MPDQAAGTFFLGIAGASIGYSATHEYCKNNMSFYMIPNEGPCALVGGVVGIVGFVAGASMIICGS